MSKFVFFKFCSLGEAVARRVSRKYSLGSSLDLVGTQCWPYKQYTVYPTKQRQAASVTLTRCHISQVKPKKDLFRQSVLPRLQRADKKHRLSASCSQLRPLDEDNTSSQLENCQSSKHRWLDRQCVCVFVCTVCVERLCWIIFNLGDHKIHVIVCSV